MKIVTILLIAMITFLTRYLFLHPGIPLRIGDKLSQFLNFSGPAVLTAIWVPIVFFQNDQVNLTYNNPYLIAASIAIIVSIKTKSVYLTLAISGFVFILLRVFIPATS